MGRRTQIAHQRKTAGNTTDYYDYVSKRSVPVISHEIDQWCVYPNFDEMKKYTGSAPHTLGILCNQTHPLFAEFPTDGCSDWQWWYVARQFRRSLLDHVASERFHPKARVTPEQIRGLFSEPSVTERLGARISASSEQSGYEVAKLFVEEEKIESGLTTDFGD